MRIPILNILAALLLGSFTTVHSQNAELLRANSPQFEAEAARLRAAPKKLFEFSKAVLGDVIRLMATEAGISFFSLPDGNPEAERLITFSLNSSPFAALETLCKANGLSLVLDGDIWYVRPADDKELIGKPYEVRHNAMEKVKKVTKTGGEGGGSSAGGSSSSSSSSSGGGGSSTQGGGVDLQGPTETFETTRSELINDIRAILDLQAESPDGTVTGGDSAGLASASAGENASLVGVPTDIYGNIRKPKVLWKSDSNTLYVVATRLQHMWVDGYLAAADKPQSLIAIEVKFFETSRDPSREFGIDWTSTLGDSGNFRAVTDITTDANGMSTVNYQNTPQTSGGFRTDLTNLLTLANLAESASTINPPMQSILSAQDVNLKLRAMLHDDETETVSYPRMVTTNNREVVIRSVVNQPVLGGSTSASLEGGSTTSSAISYLPIGTVINILPKKMQNDQINLNVAITVSSIIGTELIQGNSYPIASSRVYGAPVEINSGYTVAVGGLDEAKETKQESGIPVLNKIPGLGYLFKTKKRAKNHKNLMIFITPTLISPKDGGLPEEPQGVLPKKPENLMPQVPSIAPNGGVVGGIQALPNAVAFLARSTAEIGQVVKENRGTKADYKKMDELEDAIKRVDLEVDGYIKVYPSRWDELTRYKWELSKAKDDLAKHKRLLRKKAYF